MNTSSSILIVDDEEDACRNMADILGDFGYHVDIAFNGINALELARSHTYDVALLDLKMPGMDGLTLYRQIKKFSAGTIAIIVTAYAAKATATEALSAGAVSVFPKPVDFPRLLTIMNQALLRPMVLIVDDDEDLCETLWDLLNQHQYRVCLAHDEVEAAICLRQHNHDVVLIDMNLPQGDGRGVFQNAQQTDPQAHVIAITAAGTESEHFVQEIMAHVNNAVCYKPFDVPNLLGTISRLTRK